MKINLYHATYLAGFIGPIIIAVCSIITMLAYRGRMGQAYSPINHFVSELGQIGVSSAAAVFNTGLIIGGLFLIVFFVGLALHMQGWWRYVFGLIGLVASIFGTLVGVFPMNQLEAHTTVALTFFNTGWIAVAVFSVYIWFSGQTRFPRWLTIPAALTIISFVVFLRLVAITTATNPEVLASPTDRPDIWPLTIFEWLLLVGVMVWVVLVSWVMRLTEAQNT